MQRHAGIGYELVQVLDAPVLQTVEQLPDVHHFFATCLPVVAEQVIDVPKIILELIPLRRFCREPQLAEQQAEVPTILYFLKQRIPEQIVDNPVPHGGRGASGGLQGFLPGHSSSKRTAYKIADFPAPRSGVRRLQGFLPEQSATAFGEAGSLTIPFLVEAFKIYAQDRVLRHPLTLQLILRMTHFNATLPPHPGSELRTRAHGRWLLMTSPWSSRRRRSARTSLTLTSSTWSLMGAGGGASGSHLASSVAGGWPRQMGHRLAIRHGGPRGSLAEGQGDWGLVRQWIHDLRQLLGACVVLYFFLREDELGS